MLERKSSRDLDSSIRDGRYLAQKWRMLSCGLRNRFYLTETDDMGQLGGGAHKRVGWGVFEGAERVGAAF